LKAEATHRQQNDDKRRRKLAGLTRKSDLDLYDHSFENGMSKTRINQLRELNWLDQGYDLMLMGSFGVGKTMLAGVHCTDAIEKGYKSLLQDHGRAGKHPKRGYLFALMNNRRLKKADFMIVDDIMLFPMGKNRALGLYGLYGCNVP